jgi:biotin carboxyl carrier protein
LPIASQDWEWVVRALIIAEAMKRKIAIAAPCAGTIVSHCQPGQVVQAGLLLAVIGDL